MKFLISRSCLGQFKSRRAYLHRMLWNTQKFRNTLVESAFTRARRLVVSSFSSNLPFLGFF